MKKYLIKYAFDVEDKRYVAVCPEFFGFILYHEDLKKLKASCLSVLRVYTKNKELTGKNIEFEEKSNELAMEA